MKAKLLKDLPGYRVGDWVIDRRPYNDPYQDQEPMALKLTDTHDLTSPFWRKPTDEEIRRATEIKVGDWVVWIDDSNPSAFKIVGPNQVNNRMRLRLATEEEIKAVTEKDVGGITIRHDRVNFSTDVYEISISELKQWIEIADKLLIR